MLFVSTGLGQIAALDATTGRTRWVYDPESYTGGRPANVIGFQTRGVAYWSEGTNGRILFGTNDGYLVAIDARTGAPISEFGNNGRVDLTTGIPGAERGKRPQLAARRLVQGRIVAFVARLKVGTGGSCRAVERNYATCDL